MTRFAFQAILTAGVSLACLATAAQAQYPAVNQAYYGQPKKIVIDPNPRHGAPVPVHANAVAVGVVPQQTGYVQLDAPLYPVPRPNIPYQVGSVMITNQAFAPHEMLYPHTYRAMYPPYYYRVKGKWHGFLGCSHAHECWELQGTEVEVQYRSHLPLMSRFHNPFSLFD